MNEQAPVRVEPILYGKPLKFNPKAHRYSWDGRSIPSVTTIIGRLAKPALIQWSANCAVDYIRKNGDESVTEPGLFLVTDDVLEDARGAHTTIRDSAGDVGTHVHEFAKALLASEPLPVIEGQIEARCCKSLLDWAATKTFLPAPGGCERKVMSLKGFYAGTCDYFGMIDGSPAVLDFKTGGRKIYDEAWLQTAAYEYALCEELELDPDNIWRWVVHIDKDTGKVTPERKLTSSAHTGAWLALLDLDKHMRLITKEAA